MLNLNGNINDTNSNTNANANTNTDITDTTTTSDSTTNAKAPAEKLDDILTNIQKINSLVTSLNSIQNNATELNYPYEEVLYFNRMVSPLVNTLYFMGLATQAGALTSQALNNINLAKPKQVEASIDLTYDLVRELQCLLDVLKVRLECYLAMVETDNRNC